ncbi:MAG: amino acid adenylation domain-containing protein, partial [Terriglobales bacterium]
AYVPLDPAYPRERIGYILEDAKAPLLLTQQSLLAELAAYSGVAIALDQQWHRIARESATNPAPDFLSESLAYVIYTSGSTGKPKGVQISHRAFLNLLASMAREPRINSEDILLAVTSLSFDIAGLEFHFPWVHGARVRILSRESCADGQKLRDEVNRGATILQATPTSWLLLLEAGWSGSPQLKVMCGGEAMTPELAGKLVPRSRVVWNMYGPTETTVYSLIDKIEEAGERISIGRPIANTQAYVLDEYMAPVPVGIVGELYIGGDGLARGYLRRSDLTAERFVPDPFSASGGERLYRTGDWARPMANGKIECLGRMDYQVKIRGYRIELGEIESAMLEHPAVERAVVMVRDSQHGNKELIGYAVPCRNQTINTRDLQFLLSTKLPRHMVPSRFVVLAEMPLTSNGKIDRKALPAASSPQPKPEPKSVAPSTSLEQVVADIWAEVLQVDRVGVEDDFFQLGGHSLLAAQVVSRIRRAYQVDLPLRRLFEKPSVRQLAGAIEDALTEQIEMLSEAEVQQMLEAGPSASGTSV